MKFILLQTEEEPFLAFDIFRTCFWISTLAKRRWTLVTTSWTLGRTGTRIETFGEVLIALISTGFVINTGLDTVISLGQTEIDTLISKFEITRKNSITN